MLFYQFAIHTISISNASASAHKCVITKGKEYVILNIQVFNILNTTNLHLQLCICKLKYLTFQISCSLR